MTLGAPLLARANSATVPARDEGRDTRRGNARAGKARPDSAPAFSLRVPAPARYNALEDADRLFSLPIYAGATL